MFWSKYYLQIFHCEEVSLWVITIELNNFK
jgi:hypothetical protein